MFVSSVGKATTTNNLPLKTQNLLYIQVSANGKKFKKEAKRLLHNNIALKS